MSRLTSTSFWQTLSYLTVATCVGSVMPSSTLARALAIPSKQSLLGQIAFKRGNYDEAVTLLDGPARNGDVKAQLALAAIFRFGGGGIKPDDTASLRYTLMAAEARDGSAEYDIANSSASTSPGERHRWLERSASHGFGRAITELAVQSAVEATDGLQKIALVNAVQVLERRARTGDSLAQTKLIEIYRGGLVNVRDQVRALAWLDVLTSYGLNGVIQENPLSALVSRQALAEPMTSTELSRAATITEQLRREILDHHRHI